MKRDWFTVRRILLAIEAFQGLDIPPAFEVPGSDPDAVQYHLLLLHEAGWIEGDVLRADGDLSTVHVSRLTWRGCDALDGMRSESLLKRILTQCREKAGSFAADVVLELAKRAALEP